MSLPLAALRPLLGRLSDLKRVRVGSASVATTAFGRAWVALAGGAAPAVVARREAAAALAAVELSAITPGVLRLGGVSAERVGEVFAGAVRRAGAALPAELREALAACALEAHTPPDGPTAAIPFLAGLANQPRAGATHPTRQRLILEPAESHADHCYGVAVLGTLLTSHYGGDPAVPFLAGLAHHLHNAVLPDGGFAAEELLAADYPQIVATLTAAALAELPLSLADQVRAALEQCLPAPDAAEAKCFHAADVIDRVLEAVHADRVAQFRLATAVDELELVHAGPFKAFQLETLHAAGVLS